MSSPDENVIKHNCPPSKSEMLDALYLKQGKERTDKFQNAVVAVCGLGGLGSNIAVSLARAGVGHLILIDFDNVDITNLHRQQYKASQVGLPKSEALAANLREIAPYISLTIHNQRIDQDNIETLVGSADVICEAFDNAEAKAMLVNTILERMPDKYLVSASGMAGIGSANEIKTKRIMPHFYLCGDLASDVSKSQSLVAPRVALCAAAQALTVLRILIGEYEV